MPGRRPNFRPCRLAILLLEHPIHCATLRKEDEWTGSRVTYGIQEKGRKRSKSFKKQARKCEEREEGEKERHGKRYERGKFVNPNRRLHTLTRLTGTRKEQKKIVEEGWRSPHAAIGELGDIWRCRLIWLTYTRPHYSESLLATSQVSLTKTKRGVLFDRPGYAVGPRSHANLSTKPTTFRWGSSLMA
jgi:hypothetical protein